MRRLILLGAFLTILVVPGCAGVTQGVVNSFFKIGDIGDSDCRITGPSAVGLAEKFDDQGVAHQAGEASRQLKLLIIHGIGKHDEGYSNAFLEKLLPALGLDVLDDTVKRFNLSSDAALGQDLGTLRASRHFNKTETHELIVYELTWSPITEREKEMLVNDSSDRYSARSAKLNSAGKHFVNDAFSDVMLYAGNTREPILSSVRQAFCWMTTGDWADLAPLTNRRCDIYASERVEGAARFNIAIVTHSLGSRVAFDAVQYYAELASADPRLELMMQANRGVVIPIYMLSNQLPFLQLGRTPPTVVGEIDNYCKPAGSKYAERLTQIRIHAFSDPNDIFSYSISADFGKRYIDSRMCPKITNISLNMPPSISIFGLGELANPYEAHTGYWQDDRVIAYIAHGVGTARESDVIADRCQWFETRDIQSVALGD